jgi:hypothetical protein
MKQKATCTGGFCDYTMGQPKILIQTRPHHNMKQKATCTGGFCDCNMGQPKILIQTRPHPDLFLAKIKMFSRLFFISSIILTTNLITFKSAAASEVCTFTQVNPGTLVTGSGNLRTQLVTFTEAGGSPIQMNATCNEAAKITISAPIQVRGPEFTPTSSVAIVTTSFGSTKTGDTPLALPAGTTPLTINLSIDRGRRLRAGNYSYTFKFTVVR